MAGERFDAIVIGGGQNGLAAAARLAAAGRRVVVLERRPAVGGLCAAEEFHPGYVAPGILHDDGHVRADVVARLGLERHGLAFRDAPPVLLAEAQGPGLLLHRDAGAAAEELAGRSREDAEAYAGYRQFLARVAPPIAGLLGAPPPPLSPAGPGDWARIARRALGFWRLGRRDLTELLRVAPMCVADFLNERFRTPLLVEGLAAPAVVATWAGPWSAGTTTNLLLHESAPGRALEGGPPALVGALERAARAAGAEIRAGAAVARVRVGAAGVEGVTLVAGDQIDAPVVVATCDPQRAMLGLLAPGTLPVGVEREFRRIRCRGTAAKLHLALAGPLELARRPGQRFEALRVGGGHVDALERAFDAVKYRRCSAHPHLEVRVPTVADPSLAPQGHHVVSILASFAPFGLDGGWSPARRAHFTDAVLSTLERHAPGLRGRLVAHELLSPADLAERYGLTGGQLHHGEPALDQLFVLRPAPSAARYATPVRGLFLGGSGSHSGGGVTCTPGFLAAQAVLATA